MNALEIFLICLLCPWSSHSAKISQNKSFEKSSPASLNQIGQGNSENHGSDTRAKIVEKTIELLAEGDSLIELSNQTDSILVVGNTGSGKSTLVQVIAGDNSQLESYKKSGVYLIRDTSGKISEKTTISKSIFPELVIDNETNSAYYDCPGFADTRNQQPYIEIGNAYFIKKVADHGSRIKIVMVVNHVALQPDSDRDAFTSLIRHMLVLVKNVAKFTNAFALIASKVKASAGEDDEVVTNIAEFLVEVREEMKEVFVEKDLPAALQLLDAILHKNNDGEYDRIGLFRAPAEAGILSEIRGVQNNRRQLRRMITHDISYVEKTPGDFGYALSPTALLLVNDLVSGISRNITLETKSISDTLFKYMVQEVNDFAIDPQTNLGIFSDPEKLAESLNLTDFENKVNSYATPNLITMQIVSKLKEFSSPSPIEETKFTSLVNQGNYMKFLLDTEGNNIQTDHISQWILPVQNLVDHFSYYLAKNFTHAIHQSMLKAFNIYASRVIDKYETTAATEDNMANNGIHDRTKKVQSDFKQITQWKNELKLTAESPDFDLISYLESVTDGLNHIVQAEPDLEILKQIKILSSVQRVVPKEQWGKWEPLSWLQPIEDIVTTIQNENNWNEYLLDLFDDLSGSSVQVYDDKHLKDLQINENELASNATDFVRTHFGNLRSFKSFVPAVLNGKNAATNTKIRNLMLLLQTTLKANCSCMVDPTKKNVIVQGTYVAFSDVVKCIPKGAENIAVYATNTLFVDAGIVGRDINPNDNIHLILIAPKWVVSGERVFDLNGASICPSVPPTPKKANNGTRGKDGVPGLPGKNAGNIFRIWRRFEASGGAALNDTTNGGKGCPAQNGGEGGDGADGEDAHALDLKDEKNVCAAWQNREIAIRGSDYGYDIGEPVVCLGYKRCYPVRFFGEDGTSGSIGGKGGAGGYGGQPGTVRTVELGSNVVQEKAGDVGTTGTPGVSGEGGWSGKRGSHIDVQIFAHASLDYDWGNFHCHSHPRHPKPSREPSEDKQERAKSGDGTNTFEQKSPNPSREQTLQFHATYINRFKEVARSDLANAFLRKSLSDFLLELDTDTGVQKIYDASGLYEELISLESQGFQNSQDLLPFYESLLNRTHSKLIDSYNQNSSLTISRKVLGILYGAILSKVVSIKTPLESILVIDIAKYFENAEKNVESFREIVKNEMRHSIVEAQKEQYQARIDEKFTEAYNLIEKVIKPEITNIQTKIENNIVNLLKEIDELKKKKEKEREKLLEKEKELQKQMALGILFGTLKVACVAASLLGPIGMAAGAVVATGVGIAEKLTADSPIEERLLTLPKSIQEMYGTVTGEYKKYTKDRLKAFKDQMSDVKELIEDEDVPEKTSTIHKTVDDILKKIDIANKTNEALGDVSRLNAQGLASYTASENLIQTSKEELKPLLDKYKKSVEKEERENEKFEKKLEKVEKVIAVVGAVGDIISNIHVNQAQMAILQDQISKSWEENKKLAEHKKNIYSTLIPMVTNMTDDINNFQSDLGSRSAVSLEVGKWQVSQALRNIQNNIKTQFTEGFKTEPEMSRCYEMLVDAITTQINVYDRLQAYSDQAQLAKFIAAIGSTSFVSLDISDPKLLKMVGELDILTQSNLLIQQYQSSLNSFKMWVFPFTNLYTGDLEELPSNSTNLEELATSAGTNIKKLLAKLKQYQTTIVSYDSNLHHRNFTGCSFQLSSCKLGENSFMVWSHEDYGREIGNFLSGQRVVLPAVNVDDYHKKMDAIKFSRLELQFILRNNSAEESRLLQNLNPYQVMLTHSGNSYYRYKNETVSITTEQLDITYSFLKDNSNGLPHDRNQVYDKLRSGDIVLSPYTLWELQLIPLPMGQPVYLREFAKMPIDLVLNGEGTYVDN